MPYSFNDRLTPENLNLLHRSKEMFRHSEENPEWSSSKEFVDFTLNVLNGFISQKENSTISKQTLDLEELLRTHTNSSFHECTIHLNKNTYLINQQNIDFTNCSFVLGNNELTSIAFEVDGELGISGSVINFDLIINGKGAGSSFQAYELNFQKVKLFVKETSTEIEFLPTVVLQGRFEDVSVDSVESSVSVDLVINCELLNNLTLSGRYLYVKMERKLFLTVSESEKRGWLKLFNFSCDFLRFEVDFYFSNVSIDEETFKYFQSLEFKKRAQNFLENQSNREVEYVYFWSLDNLKNLLIASHRNRDVKKLASALGFLSRHKKGFSFVSFLYYDVFLCFYSVKRLLWISLSVIFIFWMLNFSVKFSLTFLDDVTLSNFLSINAFKQNYTLTKFLLENCWNELASRFEGFIGIVSSVLVGWVITREMD